MSVQLPSSQVVVVSGGEDDRELSKPKVRVRSDIIEKSTKRSGKQSQAKIPTGFPVDDKEVKTTYTDVFFHICMICLPYKQSISPPPLRLSVCH